MEEKEIKKEEVKETKKEIKKTKEIEDAGMQENKKQDAKKEKNASKKKNTKKEKEIEVPEGFTKKTNLNKKEYGYYNGRKYQVLKNGYGMWADTGTAFIISELD